MERLNWSAAWHAAARGAALFLGGFSVLNLLGDLRTPGFDANVWWIDFRPLPVWVGRSVLVVLSGLLLAWGIRSALRPWRLRATVAVIVLALGVALWNSGNFYRLLLDGSLRTAFPVPFSAFVGIALAGILAAALRSTPVRAGRFAWAPLGLTVAACAVGFPLAQMLCFGKTDYRRPADAVVVFGARVYADGRPSLSLSDRVATACRLYQAGLVRQVVFSGGPGDGEVHETEAMHRMAREQGIPETAIFLEQSGLSTEATVRNILPIFPARGIRRVLAASHFYHLPRIKLCFLRAGWDVYCVPAEESRPLAKLPWFVLREVAALWVYYLRPLWDG